MMKLFTWMLWSTVLIGCGVGSVANAQTLHVSELVDPITGSNSGNDRKMTAEELQFTSSIEPNFFSFTPRLNYTTEPYDADDVYLGTKNVSVATIDYKIDTDAKMTELYLIVRTGDSEFKAPWLTLKEITIRNGKKIVGKVDASKKSNWQKSDQKLKGLSFYFITFKKLKLDVRKDALVKLTVSASTQTKISPSVFEFAKNQYPDTSPVADLGNYKLLYLFGMPETNGLSFVDKNGKKLYLDLSNVSTPENASLFVDVRKRKSSR